MMTTRRTGWFACAFVVCAIVVMTVSALDRIGPQRIDEWRMRALSTHDWLSMTKLRAASRAGNEAASFALGSVLVAASDKNRVAEGIALLKNAAEDGDVRAQLELGRVLLKGAPGIAPDYELSRHWLTRAAESLPTTHTFADPEAPVSPAAYAAFHLASIYRNGYGVARNGDEGLRWLTRAANAGVPQAQFQLANTYRDGGLVPISDELALLWLQRAAQAELPEANLALAIAYRNGELGLPRNDAQYWSHIKETAHGYKHYAAQ
jgi:TPR repeat protein